MLQQDMRPTTSDRHEGFTSLKRQTTAKKFLKNSAIFKLY